MNIKKIKISKNNICNISFEDIIKQFQPLLNKIAIKWSSYEYEEIYQLALIGLWKSFQNYDINKNITFGYFANKVITNEILLFLRNTKSKQNNLNCSLNNVAINDNNNGKGKEYIELIVCENFEDTIMEKIEIENILDTIDTEKKLLIIDYFLKEKKQKEIAEKYNTSQANISKQLNLIIAELKKINNIDDSKLISLDLSSNITFEQISFFNKNIKTKSFSIA